MYLHDYPIVNFLFTIRAVGESVSVRATATPVLNIEIHSTMNFLKNNEPDV